MWDLFYDSRVQSILISILCGAIIGFEREYRNKSAGFRTVVLICFGATLFTLASQMGGMSDDRIASNIVTGIGFLGAGVIFKGKVSVQGLTTAAVIWTIAGIGVLNGFGEFRLAIIATIIMLLVLALFYRFEQILSNFYFVRTIHVTFKNADVSNFEKLEDIVKTHKVRSTRKGVAKDNDQITAIYEISGSIKNIRALNEEILETEYISSFYNN